MGKVEKTSFSLAFMHCAVYEKKKKTVKNSASCEFYKSRPFNVLGQSSLVCCLSIFSKDFLSVTNGLFQFIPYATFRQCVCVYSNSCNDVPRVAQRYGTIAAHTRRRASVLVVLVVFCVHMRSFAGLIRQMPPPTFSDTAITDRHSDTTNFQLRAHWVRISWSIGSEK